MVCLKSRNIITFLSLLLLLGMTPLSVAQTVDVPSQDADKAKPEPTPVQEFAPSGTQIIPGNEPLYDKGVTVTQIEIIGNKIIPAQAILNAIETKPGSLYSKRRLQNDLKHIYEMGYFSENLRVVPIATREGVHLRYEVEENPVVNAFQFSGETVLKEEKLRKIFVDQVGKPQNANAINKGIQEIEQDYKDGGYILARVDDIEENPPGTIKLTISEGKIHNIAFTGNKKTKDFVIRRAMAQKEGEIYNEKTVNADMKRIFGLQMFSDVRRVVKASAVAPGDYDLVVEVDEKKTGAISLGGGVDTGMGLFGSVGYSDPNFTGRGQNFSTIFSVGSGILISSKNIVRHRVLQYQTSWFNPSIAETNNSLGASVYARSLASFNVPLALETRYGSEVDWGHPIEAIPNSSFQLGLGFERTHLKEGTDQATLDAYNVSPTERQRELKSGTYAFLSPTFNYDTRNNRFSPSQGWLNTVNTRFALGIQNNSYATVTANLRRYLRVTDSVTLAVNAQGGSAMAGNVPDFNRFQLGGPYTVRGFQMSGIGIGEDYALGSAELRARIPYLKRFKKMPFYDMVQLALFTDAGVLSRESQTNSIFHRPGYGASVGGGIRMNIPAVGPLRIDWATPITGGSSYQTMHFNFGVGQKF